MERNERELLGDQNDVACEPFMELSDYLGHEDQSWVAAEAYSEVLDETASEVLDAAVSEMLDPTEAIVRLDFSREACDKRSDTNLRRTVKRQAIVTVTFEPH